MKLCPCGNAGEPMRVCTCAESEILKYRARLSGPLADRIDMHVGLGAVPATSLHAGVPGEPSATIRRRVETARGIQRTRYASLRRVSCNADAAGRWLVAHGQVEPCAREVLVSAMEALRLSARGYHRVLRVARTIADLDESLTVTAGHMSEALRYRPR